MLKKMLREMPLFGGLVDCGLSDHWEAAQQLFVVLVFSTIPIWLGSFLVWITGEASGLPGLGEALRGSVENGELFIFSTTLLAPIFWIALIDPPGARIFPSKVSHMLFIGVVNLVAAGVFGIQKSGRPLNTNAALTISFWLFLFSLLLLYLGTVYHNSRLPDAAKEFKDNENDFIDRFRGRNE